MIKVIAILLGGILIAFEGCSLTKGLGTATTDAVNGATSIPSAQVQLSWKANIGEQQGFYVEESSDGVTFTTVQTIAEPGRTATVSLPSGQTATFRIQGYNQVGTSPATTTVTVTAPATTP